MIISYPSKYRSLVLNSFGLKVSDGLVVDKKTGISVPDNLGTPISGKKFGGVRKGSLEFINKDVGSLIKLSKSQRKGK